MNMKMKKMGEKKPNKTYQTMASYNLIEYTTATNKLIRYEICLVCYSFKI